MNSIIKEYGLIRYLLENGGRISSLDIKYPNEDGILTSMNPSIWAIDNNTAYINIRGVNYNLFNCYSREITQDDQPIAYVCKESTHLITENYFGIIDLNTFEISNMTKVEMMYLHEPNWAFVGLEDARIIVWDNNIWLCGVRRDIKDDGEGRMELSKIEWINNHWKEVERHRIPASGDNTAYLEKNWMPIVDQPYTWLKWCWPVEIATYNVENNKLDVLLKDHNCGACYRGDSHVVRYGNYYYCFVHNCYNKQLNPRTNARISRYYHHILKFDLNMNFISSIGPFAYSNDFSVEFGCGLCLINDKMYLTFCENDGASFIIEFDASLIEKIFENNNG